MKVIITPTFQQPKTNRFLKTMRCNGRRRLIDYEFNLFLSRFSEDVFSNS